MAARNNFKSGSCEMIDNHYISDYKAQTGKRLIKVYYHIEPASEERLEKLLSDYHKTVGSIDKILNFDFTEIEDTHPERR